MFQVDVPVGSGAPLVIDPYGTAAYFLAIDQHFFSIDSACGSYLPIAGVVVLGRSERLVLNV